MNYASSFDDIAKHFDVTRHTVREWSRRAGFPAKTKKGWNLNKIDSWLQQKSLGPYRQQQTASIELDGQLTTLVEARIRKTIESAERDRIAKEKALIDLEQTKGNFLITDDVRARDQLIAASVITILEQIPYTVLRQLPENMRKQTRKRIFTDTTRVIRDALAAIEEMVRST